MRIFRKNLSALSILVLGFCGCVHPISERFRQSVDPTINFPKIFQATQIYKNKPVIFGGMITEIRNLSSHTEIEVLQKELDAFGWPDHRDESGGRFIFVKDGFLDPQIFAKGRYITGAGKLEGNRLGKIDKQNYRFPIIKAQQLHLWQERIYEPHYGPYRYGGFYGGFFRHRMYLGLGYPYW